MRFRISDFGFRISVRAVLLALVLIEPAAAQIPAGAAGGFQPASPADAPFRESVTLDTDSSVSKKLGTVHDYVVETQWAQAVDILQEISRTHGETLISLSPGRYVNIATYCNLVLAGFPPEGLAAYRQKADPRARQLFELAAAARSAPALRELLREAFASSYGDDAAWRLGEIYWEGGAYSAARSTWRQLLPLPGPVDEATPLPVLRYPDSRIDPAAVRARLVMCSIFEGNQPRAEQERAAFRKLHPDAEGTLAGRSGKLADILDAVAAETSHWKFPPETGDISTFGLHPSRNRILPRAVEVGALQWSARLKANVSRTFMSRPGMADQGVLSYYPVVYGNMVLVNDADAVYAWNLDTGEPFWPTETRNDEGELSAAIFPTVPSGRTGIPPRSIGVPRFTMTLDEGRLYARMGSPVSGKSSADPSRLYSDIIGLDLARGEGKLVWKVSASSIDPESTDWAFEGSPLAADGRVYAALRRSNPQTQVNVACFDGETAKLLWNRRVCSSVGQAENTFNFISHNLLTFGEDTLFYSTDLGAVVALNPEDGSLKWVVTYPSAEPQDPAILSDQMRQGLVPCVYHQGTVFVSPGDSRTIFAINAETGLIEWKTAINDRIRDVLGVGSGNLILSGNGLYALDAESGRLVWKISRTDPAEYGYGRGLLVQNDVWWPTRERILIVDQAGGGIRDEISLANPVRNVTGGNLLIAGDHLLIAQPDQLIVFSEYAGIIKRHKDEIVANPRAPLPYYHLARAEEATGQTDLALADYSHAIEHAADADRINGRPLKSVAGEALYRLLMQTGRGELTNRQFESAASRFETAAAVAADPESRLDALESLARASVRGNDPERATAAYQRILVDPSLASIRPSATVRQQPAGLAREQIHRLIGKHGRAVYAAFDAAARDELQAAFEAGDVSQFQSALRRYPNAEHVEAWQLKLARLHRSRAEPREAVGICKQVLKQTREQPALQERVDARIELAETLEEMQYWRPAARAWKQLAAELPAAETLVDGKKETLLALVTRRLQRQPILEDELSPPGPPLQLPLSRRWKKSIAANSQPVVPEGTPPSAALSFALLNSNGTECIESNTGTTRWKNRLSAPAVWAACLDTHLVLATSQELVGVAYETGKTLWQHSLPGDFNADASRFRCHNGLVYCLIPGAGVSAFDGDDGSIAWEIRPAVKTIGPWWYCDDQVIVLQTLDPHQTVVCDAATGQQRASIPGDDCPWLSAPLYCAPDLLALVTADRRIRGLSLNPPRNVWTYQGQMSFANVDPILRTNGSQLLLVVDGDTLVKLSPETGQTVWTSGLGRSAVANPERSIVLDGDNVYAASSGILRCFDLANGRLRWEQWLGSADREWTVSRSGDFVAAIPRREPAALGPADALVFCEAKNGRFVQKLALQQPAIHLHLEPGSAALLTVGNETYGLAR